MTTYKIVRKHFRDKNLDEVLNEGLTFEEAQDHCNDPETSSNTCRSKKMIKYTEIHGPWFDAYYEE